MRQDQTQAISVLIAALGPDREHRLRVASQLVRSVRDELNTDSGPCQSCGCKIYTDWPEANAAKTLDGAAGRIDRVVGVLETLTSEGGGR